MCIIYIDIDIDINIDIDIDMCLIYIYYMFKINTYVYIYIEIYTNSIEREREIYFVDQPSGASFCSLPPGPLHARAMGWNSMCMYIYIYVSSVIIHTPM